MPTAVAVIIVTVVIMTVVIAMVRCVCGYIMRKLSFLLSTFDCQGESLPVIY
jgi:hypothetical protein